MRWLIALTIFMAIGSAGEAQSNNPLDARNHIPDRLVDALEWSVPGEEVAPDHRGRITPWQVCRFCARETDDNIEATVLYVRFLKEVTLAVRDAVGFAEQPKAPDFRKGFVTNDKRVRGAVIVKPSQDSKILGFWAYRLRMDGEKWFLDTVGISTRPVLSDDGKLISNDCRRTKQLNNTEKRLILSAAHPNPRRAPLFGQPYAGFPCIDGSPTISEISYVDGRGERQRIASKWHVRECGMDDDIARFNEVIMIIGSMEARVQDCIWRDPATSRLQD